METELSQSLREERVAMLLSLFGKETSEQIFPHLDPAIAARLRRKIPEFETVPPTVRKQINLLDEYERFFDFAQVNIRPQLKLVSEDDDEQDDDSGSSELELTGDPIVDIDRLNIFQLASALDEEQARTVALILKIVSPPRIAEILELMTTEKKEQIVKEFSHDPRTPEVIMRRIASTIIERARHLPTEPRAKDDPVSRLVEVLRATEKSKRQQIIKAIEGQNPDQAALINQSLYRFEDLAGMDDQQIQKVLSRVDSSTLSTALFNADEKILERILGNLSRRARASLQEELDFRKNVTGPQLRVARQLVTTAISEAEQEADA